jgi:hypothetical protein
LLRAKVAAGSWHAWWLIAALMFSISPVAATSRVCSSASASVICTRRAISLQVPELTPDGHVTTRTRTLNIKIPKGIREGQKIRLTGQGEAAAGDLYLEIDFRPHALYRAEAHDLYLEIMTGTLIDDDRLLTLANLCRACGVPAEVINDMIEFGIIEPSGDVAAHWQFAGGCLWRVTTVVRLQRDLEVNLAGAALALDLIEEARELRRQLKPGKSQYTFQVRVDQWQRNTKNPQQQNRQVATSRRSFPERPTKKSWRSCRASLSNCNSG